MSCLYELDITFGLLITCITCKNSYNCTAMPLRTLKGIKYSNEVLEYTISIKLHVYLPALNCNTSMSSQLVSDYHMCKIYSTGRLSFTVFFCWVEIKLLIFLQLCYSPRNILKEFCFGLLGWLFTIPRTHNKWQADMIFLLSKQHFHEILAHVE